MTTSPNTFVAAVLAAFAGAAFAAAPDEDVARVDVTAARDARSAADVVLATRRFDSTYAIDGGRRLVVRSAGNALSVRYGRRPVLLLQHDGQGVFVSRDGALLMRFALDADGEPATVQLNMPARWL
ncbi:MAG: hypothetical protein MUE62_08560 [Burkholderiaceae bacterium]|jgi:hypothetical protein|nr:hypothetical protein [Burkholderiaceae bacterium]